MKRALVFAAILAVLATLAACGGSNRTTAASPTPTPTPTPTPSGSSGVPAGKGVIELRVEVRGEENADPTVSTLTCTTDEQTGTGALAAKAADACANARQNADLLVKGPPQDRMCTEIYGGPQIAVVTGTLDGEEVDRTFTRSDGCQIADWDTLQPLLGAPPDQND